MAQPRPKLAYKGRDRKRIKQLANFVKQVQDMDTRNTAKAAEAGVPPILFSVVGATSYAAQLAAIAARCETALTQTVSVQAVPPPQA